MLWGLVSLLPAASASLSTGPTSKIVVHSLSLTQGNRALVEKYLSSPLIQATTITCTI